MTLREGESPEDGVRRLGREKLGVDLTPLESLAEGEQQRDGYVLHMTVYAASITGEPRLPPRTGDTTATLYEAIDWLDATALQPAAEAGSLCCKLFLGPHPDPSPTSGRGEKLHVTVDRKRQMMEQARTFRKEPTRSEELLWERLRRKGLDGHKFRRQHPYGPFILDFYCPERRLAVEVDGSIHASQAAADEERQELLEASGLKVLRVRSHDVENNIDAVLSKIREAFD